MEGTLSKWTDESSGWQERYFVLNMKKAEITYYTEKNKKKNPRGRFVLKDTLVGIEDMDNNIFTLTSMDDRIVYFKAMDKAEKMKWVEKIEEVTSSFLKIESVDNLEKNYAEEGENIKQYNDASSDVEEIDENRLYSADETVGKSSSSNKSVIKHLIKQVKIGMDLTQLTLPTFILERRSLLEMLADFFSHCDLFVNVTNFDNPRDRIVEMVRAFLSCFHAGRNPDIAKKPYNPILGEIFRCYWRLEDSEVLNESGPVPYATEGDMTFLVEQVSHHPPVSAFFAENRSKGVNMEGQVWTKSRFLGFSIGVEMIGSTTIKLDQHGETYNISFPGGYARSILTVPWFELGGKVEIKSSSGYSAAVQFHTKPMYKNVRNEITAEIYAPGEKSSFCTVKGAWNGIMTATYSKDPDPKVFFDCSKVPIVQKVVQPVKMQEPNESRRLWYDVTKYLYKHDINQAAFHKHKLEEKQRSDRKERLNNKIEYKPKVG